MKEVTGYKPNYIKLHIGPLCKAYFQCVIGKMNIDEYKKVLEKFKEKNIYQQLDKSFKSKLSAIFTFFMNPSAETILNQQASGCKRKREDVETFLKSQLEFKKERERLAGLYRRA